MAACAPSDAIITTNGNLAAPRAYVSLSFFSFSVCLFVCLLLSGKGGCLSQKYTEDNVRNQFIIKDVLHNTMPFTQRSSGLCQLCSHSFKQPGFSNLLILFVVTKPPYLYEDLRGL